MKTVVVDASTALKMHFPDEPHAEVSERLFTSFAAHKLHLIAPSLWLYEVFNGIRSAILRRRITPREGRAMVRDVAILAVELHDCKPLMNISFELANIYDISIYDAAYVALAKKRKIVFVTADRRLFLKFEKKIPLVHWIGDYW